VGVGQSGDQRGGGGEEEERPSHQRGGEGEETKDNSPCLGGVEREGGEFREEKKKKVFQGSGKQREGPEVQGE